MLKLLHVSHVKVWNKTVNELFHLKKTRNKRTRGLPLSHPLPLHIIAAWKKMCLCVHVCVVIDDGLICKLSSLASPLHLRKSERVRMRKARWCLWDLTSCHTAHDMCKLCVCLAVWSVFVCVCFDKCECFDTHSHTHVHPHKHTFFSASKSFLNVNWI